MKKIYLAFLGSTLLSLSAFAQSPEKMSYQAVIRNNVGDLMTNTSLGFKVQILKGSEYGAAVFVETHTGLQSNHVGLVTAEIGTGTSVLGDFSSIDWSDGAYFMKTEIDPTGGTSYSLTTIKEILSVPYAIYSNKADSAVFAKNADTANFTNLSHNAVYADTAQFAHITSLSLNEAYNSGKTIIASSGAVEIAGKDGLLVRGKYNEGLDVANWTDSTGNSKMFFNPKKSALRAGFINNSNWNKDSVGFSSVAMGYNTKASGDYSIALGNNTSATGIYSTASGRSSEATNSYSTSMGDRTKATGNSSVAFGSTTQASGSSSTALGDNTRASGNYSTALGSSTQASGNYSTASGRHSKASGETSVALGFSTEAIGSSSVSIGNSSKASGDNSVALGYSANATGSYSMALGFTSNASGNGSTSIGTGSAAGLYSMSLGSSTNASGDYSTAIGKRVDTDSKTGAFIIGDNYTSLTPSTTRKSTANNQFTAIFGGGYRLFTNTEASTSSGGVMLVAGGSSWSSISDSTKKENFLPVNGVNVLSAIKTMRLGTWNYKGQDPKEFRHYGPMAQEFYANFGTDALGIIGNDTMIASADIDGVMMIAIQELIKENELLKHENEQLKIATASLEEKVSEIDVLRNNVSSSQSEIELLKTAVSSLMHQSTNEKQPYIASTEK